MGLGRVAGIAVTFWPFWPGYGEPDVVLTIVDAGGVPTAVVVVEAKLHAPKSGRAGPDDEEVGPDDPPNPDQLVRYWQGLTRRQEILRGATPAIVYLTHHTAPPAEELVQSLRLAPGMRLAWLSWRDIWGVANQAAGRLPAEDLARLLAHKGLKYFDGYHAKAWQAPTRKRFWRAIRWFSQHKPWTASSGCQGFWSRGETDDE